MTTQLGRIESDVLAALNLLRAMAAQVSSLTTSVGAVPTKQDLANLIADLDARLDRIEQDVNGGEPDTNPATVRFVVIRHRNIETGEEIDMAQSLMNDVISNIPVEFDNLAGQKVDAPQGGTITLSVVDSSGAPSSAATAAMGSDGSSVDVTPTPGDGTNMEAFTLMFEDQANADMKASLDCNFTNDPNAANVHFVTTGITTRPIGS